jgi:hypothetical protein
MHTLVKHAIEPELLNDSDAYVIERPDGFYWQSKGEECGPFKTVAAAVEDMEVNADADFEPPDADSLEEAEAEFGLGWIDPETGEQREDGAPRIEDR